LRGKPVLSLAFLDTLRSAKFDERLKPLPESSSTSKIEKLGGNMNVSAELI
jgi:hypothetical protein